MILGKQSVSEHFRLIRQNYDWLIEKLEPDHGLLSILFASEVINSREYEQIHSEKNHVVKNEILLSIISRKSFEDFKKFKTALKETTQKEIINRLNEASCGMLLH